MRRAFIVTLLLSSTLPGSDARFTDELWVPIEPRYQKMSAVPSNRAGGQRELLTGALREALEALASKAPDTDWRAFLIADADQLPQKPKNPVRMTRATESYSAFLLATVRKSTFGEGLTVVLAEYWIDFELTKDRGESTSREFVETVASLNRMTNSVAARSDDAGRARLKQIFADAAQRKFSFELQ
jgi:hypothetical protein